MYTAIEKKEDDDIVQKMLVFCVLRSFQRREFDSTEVAAVCEISESA